MRSFSGSYQSVKRGTNNLTGNLISSTCHFRLKKAFAYLMPAKQLRSVSGQIEKVVKFSGVTWTILCSEIFRMISPSEVNVCYYGMKQTISENRVSLQGLQKLI